MSPQLREYLERFIKFGMNILPTCDLEVEKVLNGKEPQKNKTKKPLPLPNSKPQKGKIIVKKSIA